MKTLWNALALFMLLLGCAACEDDETAASFPEVTAATLNGTWQLVEFDGHSLNAETYCYLHLIRRDRTFEMYSNLQTGYADLTTGSFEIEQDPYLGAVISGDYAFGNGKWNHEYIVSELTADGKMVWVNKDDASQVQVFRRCERVPQEIVDAARPVE